MRPYQSPSSLSLFLKCPHAYYLSYIKKVETKVSDDVLFGKWVHEQLENNTDMHPDAQPYVDDLNNWLEVEEDKIEQHEISEMIEIDGMKLKIIKDAITKKGRILDFKITQSPGFYGTSHSLQMKIYSLSNINAPRPILLLFHIKKIKTDSGHMRKYLGMKSEYVCLKNRELQETIRQLKTIHKMIDTCEKDNEYPPSLNGCGRCFYKESCDYYSGF